MYQRLGIGTYLMKLIRKKCRKYKNVKFIYLHTVVNNLSARKFYEKLGYTISSMHKQYYENVINGTTDAFVYIYCL